MRCKLTFGTDALICGGPEGEFKPKSMPQKLKACFWAAKYKALKSPQALGKKMWLMECVAG